MPGTTRKSTKASRRWRDLRALRGSAPDTVQDRPVEDLRGKIRKKEAECVAGDEWSSNGKVRVNYGITWCRRSYSKYLLKMKTQTGTGIPIERSSQGERSGIRVSETIVNRVCCSLSKRPIITGEGFRWQTANKSNVEPGRWRVTAQI